MICVPPCTVFPTVVPQVKPGSAEMLASSSSEASVSGQVCAPQHYTHTNQEGGYVCPTIPTEMPCCPRITRHTLHHHHPTSQGSPAYANYMAEWYIVPLSANAALVTSSAPLPLPQCTHQQLSPSNSCMQVAPTMGCSCQYGGQSPSSPCIPVLVLSRQFGSLHYRASACPHPDGSTALPLPAT